MQVRHERAMEILTGDSATLHINQAGWASSGTMKNTKGLWLRFEGIHIQEDIRPYQ